LRTTLRVLPTCRATDKTLWRKHNPGTHHVAMRTMRWLRVRVDSSVRSSVAGKSTLIGVMFALALLAMHRR
jgi:hypothetical protein